jgi:predicted DCC family thiol-disulfide oxidoreductase YuxK
MILLTHGVSEAAFSYRNDSTVPPFPDEHPVIFFDGYCVLCSGLARFVLRHDRQGQFRLAAAQSPLGQAVFRHFGLDPMEFESNLLLSEGRAWDVLPPAVQRLHSNPKIRCMSLVLGGHSTAVLVGTKINRVRIR